MDDLVGTADLRRTSPKSNTSNWSYNLYKITEINNVTKPSNLPDILPERYNGALLNKHKINSGGEKNHEQDKYHLVHIKVTLFITTHRN